MHLNGGKLLKCHLKGKHVAGVPEFVILAEVCYFVLWFNVPVNTVSIMLGWNVDCFLDIKQYSGELMCFA